MRIMPLTVAVLIAAGFAGFAGAQEDVTEPPPAHVMPPADDCTITTATLCTAENGCQASETFGELILPARLLVDFHRRVIVSVNADGLPHLSEIDVFVGAGETFILQGVDGETGWMIKASATGDDMSFVAASPHTVLTAFGTCSAVE